MDIAQQTLIKDILKEQNCSIYIYNQENNIIERKGTNNSATYGVKELIVIIEELHKKQINYLMDKNQNIQIEEK